jgi:hypothetical protein
MAVCTDYFDIPLNALQICPNLSFERTHCVHSCFFKKETVARNLFMVDKMLILIKLKHQESNFKIWNDIFMGFNSNIGFHNKNPLYYTVFHVDQQMIIYVLHTTEELDCIRNCTVIKL